MTGIENFQYAWMRVVERTFRARWGLSPKHTGSVKCVYMNTSIFQLLPVPIGERCEAFKIYDILLQHLASLICFLSTDAPSSASMLTQAVTQGSP